MCGGCPCERRCVDRQDIVEGLGVLGAWRGCGGPLGSEKLSALSGSSKGSGKGERKGREGTAVW